MDRAVRGEHRHADRAYSKIFASRRGSSSPNETITANKSEGTDQWSSEIKY